MSQLRGALRESGECRVANNESQKKVKNGHPSNGHGGGRGESGWQREGMWGTARVGPARDEKKTESGITGVGAPPRHVSHVLR